MAKLYDANTSTLVKVENATLEVDDKGIVRSSTHIAEVYVETYSSRKTKTQAIKSFTEKQVFELIEFWSPKMEKKKTFAVIILSCLAVLGVAVYIARKKKLW